MATKLTRAQLRERIRRSRLGILTPYEMNITGAAEGDAPSQQPDPTNAQLNDAIEEAVSYLNGHVGFSETGTSETSIAISAQTANGPYSYSLASVGGGSYVLNDVRIVSWVPTGGNDTGPLKPITFEELAFQRRDYRTVAPGTPTHVMIEGYAIHLFPAPSEAGTLYLRTGISLQYPTQDSHVVQQLPADYDRVIVDVAALMYCQSVPGDVEMQARVPFLQGRAQEGVMMLKKWYRNMNHRHQCGIAHRSHRSVPTMRRR